MKIFPDTASLQKVREAVERVVAEGVTTTPTPLAKAAR